jgi:hypothetical protein
VITCPKLGYRRVLHPSKILFPNLLRSSGMFFLERKTVQRDRQTYGQRVTRQINEQNNRQSVSEANRQIEDQWDRQAVSSRQADRQRVSLPDRWAECQWNRHILSVSVSLWGWVSVRQTDRRTEGHWNRQIDGQRVSEAKRQLKVGGNYFRALFGHVTTSADTCDRVMTRITKIENESSVWCIWRKRNITDL